MRADEKLLTPPPPPCSDVGRSQDTFFYKRSPGVVYLTPSYDPGARVSIDLDFAVPLRAHIPSICRRFGIRDIDFGGITRADDGPSKRTHTADAGRAGGATENL